MSELKTYLYLNDKDKVIRGYYKATEADALIAKLREEIAEAKDLLTKIHYLGISSDLNSRINKFLKGE